MSAAVSALGGHRGLAVGARDAARGQGDLKQRFRAERSPMEGRSLTRLQHLERAGHARLLVRDRTAQCIVQHVPRCKRDDLGVHSGRVRVFNLDRELVRAHSNGLERIERVHRERARPLRAILLARRKVEPAAPINRALGKIHAHREPIVCFAKREEHRAVIGSSAIVHTEGVCSILGSLSILGGRGQVSEPLPLLVDEHARISLDLARI